MAAKATSQAETTPSTPGVGSVKDLLRGGVGLVVGLLVSWLASKNIAVSVEQHAGIIGIVMLGVSAALQYFAKSDRQSPTPTGFIGSRL